MKKLIVLTAVLFGLYSWAHAVSTQSATQQGASSSTQDDAQQLATAVNGDADKVGTGSGDDADTANEAEPSNDSDPDAEENAGSQ